MNKTPDDADLVQWLGLAYARLNQPDKAAECFRKAHQLLPMDPRPVEYLAYMEVKMERWPQAHAALATVLKNSGKNYRAHTAIAVVKIKTNNLDAAEAHLKYALSVETNYPPALYNLAWLKYYGRRDGVAAAALYKRFLNVSTDPVRAPRARAVLRRIGDTTPAPARVTTPTRPPVRRTTAPRQHR